MNRSIGHSLSRISKAENGFSTSQTTYPLSRKNAPTTARTSASSSQTRIRDWLGSVIDVSDSGSPHLITSPSARGSHKSTFVPLPGELVIRTDPPDWAAKPCTIDNPNPEPRPASFVVKKGSKTRCKVFRFIPVPVSDTDTT